MTKFSRGNFKGERNIKNLKSELFSVLNSYTPSTMMAYEIDEFNTTLKAINVDFNKINESFDDETLKIISKLKERDVNYVSPFPQ